MKTKQSAHTPEPWYVQDDPPLSPAHDKLNHKIWADDDGKRLLARVHRWEKDGDGNAYLMAAAPTLLKAAKQALRDLENQGTEHETIEMLRAAITKAERR